MPSIQSRNLPALDFDEEIALRETRTSDGTYAKKGLLVLAHPGDAGFLVDTLEQSGRNDCPRRLCGAGFLANLVIGLCPSAATSNLGLELIDLFDVV